VSPLLLTLSAFASADGSQAGDPDATVFDCGQCHNQTGSFLDLAPEGLRSRISVALLDGQPREPLEVGVSRRLRVRIDSAFPDRPERRLGFAMAVVAQQPADTWQRTGTLSSDDPRTTRPTFPEVDLSHAAPIAWTAPGVAEIDVALVPEQPGDHLLYVVVNDADGDGTPNAGDYVWPQRFCFAVDAAGGAAGTECDARLGDPPPEPEPDPDTDDPDDPDTAGCTCAAGGAPTPAALAALALGIALRRRRAR
jgi:MYXO-CTERM domain-containing protein